LVLALLRPRCERPSYCAANQRDELTPLHSITSSALAEAAALPAQSLRVARD